MKYILKIILVMLVLVQNYTYGMKNIVKKGVGNVEKSSREAYAQVMKDMGSARNKILTQEKRIVTPIQRDVNAVRIPPQKPLPVVPAKPVSAGVVGNKAAVYHNEIQPAIQRIKQDALAEVKPALDKVRNNIAEMRANIPALAGPSAVQANQILKLYNNLDGQLNTYAKALAEYDGSLALFNKIDDIAAVDQFSAQALRKQYAHQISPDAIKAQQNQLGNLERQINTTKGDIQKVEAQFKALKQETVPKPASLSPRAQIPSRPLPPRPRPLAKAPPRPLAPAPRFKGKEIVLDEATQKAYTSIERAMNRKKQELKEKFQGELNEIEKRAQEIWAKKSSLHPDDPLRAEYTTLQLAADDLSNAKKAYAKALMEHEGNQVFHSKVYEVLRGNPSSKRMPQAEALLAKYDDIISERAMHAKDLEVRRLDKNMHEAQKNYDNVIDKIRRKEQKLQDDAENAAAEAVGGIERIRTVDPIQKGETIIWPKGTDPRGYVFRTDRSLVKKGIDVLT